MKAIQSGVLAVVLLSAIHSFAIEGLKISVQNSNVILSWPSTNIETYIVQYRQTLNATDSWVTLTNDYPASDSNMTFFVHSNVVQYPPMVGGGGTNGGSISPPGPMDERMGASIGSVSAAEPPLPMVIAANGSGEAAPLAIYPPGFDLSGMIIFDPATGEHISGQGYTIRSTPVADDEGGGFEPMDLTDDTNQYTGFYRVVRNGVHIYGLTNSMVISNELITPIELALDSTDAVVGVTFYDENNSPIIGASAQQVGSNVWMFVWDTTVSPNGNYDVHAELDFASDNPVVSNPVTVTVNNAISFPNYYSRVFGDQMWVYAESTMSDAECDIDIYGENTNYIGTFPTFTDNNGVVSFLWNLAGPDGTPMDDTNFYGVFTITSSGSQNLVRNNFQTTNSPAFVNLSSKRGFNPLDSGSSASAPQFWTKEPKWTPNNNWVVAYGLFNGAFGSQDQYMIAGGVWEDEPYEGVLGTLDDWGLAGNLSPGNNPSGGVVFTVSDSISRSNLLTYLADSRYENFYFFGHGNESAIGSYNGFNLTEDQIAFALGNVPINNPGPPQLINIDPPIMVYPINHPDIQHAASHPYRFVFIDACDTGSANFCEAFGIPAFTVSTNYFKSLGVESRAFVGFTDWKLNFNLLGWQGYSLMTSHFLNDWHSGVINVQGAVDNAQSDAYHTGSSMSSSAVVYGAYDLLSGTQTRP